LRDVSENERILSKGLEKMAQHLNEGDGEVKRMFTATSMLLTVNDHSMQLERAINACRRVRDFNRCHNQFTKRGNSTPHNNTCPNYKTNEGKSR
jgi:hypothetical protein